MTALVSFFAKDGATSLPGKTFGDIFAGATGTGEKFGVRNIGDRILSAALQLAIEAVIDNDGVSRVRLAADPNTLTPPVNVTITVGAAGDGGVWGATGTYGGVVTAVNATGETIESQEVTFLIDVLTKRATWGWTQVTGAAGYKLFRTATPGDYAANVLRTTIGSGATVTFVDNGTATGAGAPPEVNTTGGVGPNYGTPPAGLDTATAAVVLGQVAGTLEIGEMDFFWVNRVIPINSASAGNPRQAKLRIRET